MAGHPALDSLLDRARAEAKRLGHGTVTAVHLARVLATSDAERFVSTLGESAQGYVEDWLARVPRTFASVAVAPELEAYLATCAEKPAPLDALWDGLSPVLVAAGTKLEDTASAAAEAATPPAGAAPAYRPALHTLVALLLERSLESAAGHGVLGDVIGDAPATERLAAFAKFVFEASPVVAIESDQPYAEGVVHEILAAHRGDAVALNVLRPTVSLSGEAEYLQLQVPEQGRFVVLLPLHGGQTVLELGRVVHELAARDVSVLIGCERYAQLPEPLRRLADVRLTLPSMDRATFVALFASVFGEPPADGWDDTGTHWIRHVQHFDFEQPQRLALASGEALRFMRDRVEQRLRAVEVTGGRSLDQLHGLGEAAQFARDLIHEIAEAVAGRLPWQDVDRGVLLVGPPGTGKTSLARAIARDCGVKFISSSVSGWQAAGHLGDHIRAIRATFAEARRYAPSILFLDEIDSLGSRQNLSGPNAQYQTEVINAVLEQMQGLDPGAPVFVIAATNHASGVDPALRRAGRLDRVIEIPYPSSEALAAMFSDYLGAHASRAGVEPGVDLVLCGRLALGLTGADVDQFVRGAARRARRARRAITTADLIAEITRKPREGTVSRRMRPEEVERVAVHEAGHALARYLGSSGGRDIGFVSIVPRADGSLGFVALAEEERVLRTRAEYLELLEVLLAGRAAEELRYGTDGVSGGCSNDLASATATVMRMITRYGLGPEGRLLSVDSAQPEHAREAEALLSGTYARVLQTLRTNQPRLERLAARLLERQELTADEVRAALAES